MSLLPKRYERNFPSIADFFGDWLNDDWFTGTRFPAVDVQESDSNYTVKADLPGYTKDDIEIGLNNGVLSIKAKNETTEEVRREGYLHKERRSGSFCRSFAFPGEVDQENIMAKFENGVLTIDLPKTGMPKGRKININ